MFYSEISRILGRFFFYLTGILLIPLSVAILYEFFLESSLFYPATFAFLETMAVSLLLAHFFKYLGRNSGKELHRKESVLLVALFWFITAAVGALPFVLTGKIPDPVDAYFESMSSLTTTGASIVHAKEYDPATGLEVPITLSNPIDPTIQYTFEGTVPPQINSETGALVKQGLEALGKPLLFWRAFLQWLGGMGIVVLFIAVLPALAMGGKFLYETEVQGPSKEGMTPRIKETAGLLWKIYLGLTVIQASLLVLTNHKIPVFDAIALSFSTISTGGFLVTNDGLASYPGLSTQWILSIFMVLGSLNFSLYFYCLKGKFYRLFEPELRLYFIILIGGGLLMSWTLWHTPRIHIDQSTSYFSLKQALSFGLFQTISAQTSTGFSLMNYDYWPFSSQLLMLIMMFIGGMSGSTTGGIKVIRYVILLRVIKNKIESLFRPEVVRLVQVGHKVIPDKTVMTVLIYFCVAICLTIFGSYLLVLDNHDPETALGVISCMINNNGLLFGGAGSSGSFAFLTPFSKIVSILWMVLGRLEFFTLLVLLVPSFWKNQ